MKIQTEEPEGLQIRFSGKSRKIEVGLDPKFPVETIESSWLASLFQPEAGAALLGFVTAIAVFLLSYLFAT